MTYDVEWAFQIHSQLLLPLLSPPPVLFVFVHIFFRFRLPAPTPHPLLPFSSPPPPPNLAPPDDLPAHVVFELLLVVRRDASGLVAGNVQVGVERHLEVGEAAEEAIHEANLALTARRLHSRSQHHGRQSEHSRQLWPQHMKSTEVILL